MMYNMLDWLLAASLISYKKICLRIDNMNKRNLWKKIKTEYSGRSYATFCGMLIIVLTLSIIIFLTTKGINTFTKD